jgi:hypothetical protein
MRGVRRPPSLIAVAHIILHFLYINQVEFVNIMFFLGFVQLNFQNEGFFGQKAYKYQLKWDNDFAIYIIRRKNVYGNK